MLLILLLVFIVCAAAALLGDYCDRNWVEIDRQRGQHKARARGYDRCG